MTKELYTPMMMQYLKIKEKHSDILLFYRLGDFYELFFDDAKIASKELQLLLTGKNAGASEKIPMCGVPHHAASSYIQKLVNRGYKVGVVEQMEDPKQAKGIVERDVIQIYTPGVNVDFSSEANNFIASLDETPNSYILAYADITTGEVAVKNIDLRFEDLVSEIDNLELKEIVVETSLNASLIQSLNGTRKIIFSYENDSNVTIEHEFLFKYIKDVRQMKTIARLYNYLKETQKRDLSYLSPAVLKVNSKSMYLDSYSRLNLELSRTIRSEEKYGTLYWLLDQCETPMGSRLLKKWINEPSSDIKEISLRHDLVESFMHDYITNDELHAYLNSVYDLDRLISKINFGTANARDLLQLKKSLLVVPLIKDLLKKMENDKFARFIESISEFKEIVVLLEKSISEDAPITIRDGEIIKEGYNAELDELIMMTTDSKRWIAALETKEREKTGIHTLKVGYNRVFGYYLEVSAGNVPLVKDEFGYVRKQTLSTGERYITEELKNEEAKILSAQENRKKVEYDIFISIKNYLVKFTAEIQKLSSAIAELDIYLSFATVAQNNHYVRPVFNEERRVEVINARHPVIEKVQPLKEFVANDFLFDTLHDIIIITGPNMGGKSTYMREFALIVLMAQIGSFVPATSANLYIFDAIFTRIGASDDLISGQSTFMVEMSETNNALRKATSSSLLLFDEIGRGTATYDGMALAQSIIEYIIEKVHALTLFSTHYHEITALSKHLAVVKNIHVAAQETDGHITFLYKVKDGEMDKSYGINVARLAKLPEELLARAEDILLTLEKKKIDTKELAKDIQRIEKKVIEEPWISEMRKLDPLTLSPLEALNLLFDIKKKTGK